jgi:corrinoid protein of di/trimethylamine methyltransferase
LDSLLSKSLQDAVINGEVETAQRLSREALEKGIDPLHVITEGLTKGVREVGRRFGEGDAYLVDLVMAAKAMNAGMAVLVPKMKETKKARETLGKVIIGTVKGDIHSIGKDIVASLLEVEGFQVTNLGVDVPVETFVEKTREEKPDIVGLSALVTSTMPVQKEIVDALKKEGLRSKVKVIIGGAPTTELWAKQIGADGWTGDAVKAVELVKKLTLRTHR